MDIAKNSILITMNVRSLHTNIPKNQSTVDVKNAYDKYLQKRLKLKSSQVF